MQTDLKELVELAADPAALDRMLERALDALGTVIPYDLASILMLEGNELAVRSSRGPLANEKVRQHRVLLRAFPTIQQAMELRRPIALQEHHHHSEEGDPYDGVLDLPEGHSCMVVPLFAGEQNLGAITLDRRTCGSYPQEATELAGVYGQMVGLAIAFAQQAHALDRYRSRLKEQNRLLLEEVGGGSEAERRLQNSRSPAMRALVSHARLVAETNTAVLIQGETGSGKEVLAQAIHAWSPRRNEAFVKLNCAAIPENLVESELFGHVKGAFSGASSNRAGRFQTASGGTLLLDEIGDLPLAAQGKLLRVLQEGTIEPVGSDRSIQVDVRVVAATHVDLQKAVREGRFREDLWFRLSVFPLQLPPLRERTIDILPIAETFLHDLSKKTGRGPWWLEGAAIQRLQGRRWPGNVRELVNSLERATILRSSGSLGAELFEEGGGGALPSVRPGPGPQPAEWPDLEEYERAYLERVLAHCHGKIYGEGGAAKLLGLPPSTLQSKLKKLGIGRDILSSVKNTSS